MNPILFRGKQFLYHAEFVGYGALTAAREMCKELRIQGYKCMIRPRSTKPNAKGKGCGGETKQVIYSNNKGFYFAPKFV